jgi:peptidoglycan hydrolase CwlO-like protein
MRSSPVAWARRGHISVGAALLVVTLVSSACVSAVWLPTASADPSADADHAVAEAQQRADRAASAYFDALERGNKLDTDIATIQADVDHLDAQVARLRKVAEERAVSAYKRVGTSLTNAFGNSGESGEVVRRAALFDAVNSYDRSVANRFQDARDERSRSQQELRTAKLQQADTLDQLRSDEDHLNGLLVEAQDQRRALAAQRAADLTAAAATSAANAAPAAGPGAAPATTAPASAPATTNAPPSPGAPASTPTKAPAPLDYVPNGGTHPHHDDPFLVCTRQRESSGNYQAYNPAGYYGAYQFSQSTWNGAANHAGRGDLVGLDPRQASAYDQDDVAWTLYQWRGKGPWGGLC